MKKILLISLLALVLFPAYAQKINIELSGGLPTMKYQFKGDYSVWNDGWFFDAAHHQIGLEYQQNVHSVELIYAFLQDYRPNFLNGKNAFMRSAWQGDHRELTLAYKAKVLSGTKWYLAPTIGCTFQFRKEYNGKFPIWETTQEVGYQEPGIEPINVRLYELNRRSGLLLKTGVELGYSIHKRWTLVADINYFMGFKTLLKYEAEYYKISESPNATIRNVSFWSNGSYASFLIGVKYTLMTIKKD